MVINGNRDSGWTRAGFTSAAKIGLPHAW